MTNELPERPSPSSGIRDLLAQVLKQYGLGTDPRLRRMVAAWREAAGADYFEQTQVVSARDGVVTIQVDSAPLLQELAVYHKRALLQALKRVEPSILDLRFRPSARLAARGGPAEPREANGRTTRRSGPERRRSH